MKEISRDDLLKNVDSIYKLCNMASLRAMELNNGVKRLVDAHPNEKVSTIAIREIAENKVRLKILKKKK